LGTTHVGHDDVEGLRREALEGRCAVAARNDFVPGAAVANQVTKAEARVTKHQTDLETRFARMNKLLQHCKQTDSALTHAFNQNDSNGNTAW